jgi:hypothetical protein
MSIVAPLLSSSVRIVRRGMSVITNNAPGQNIFFYNNHPIQFVSLVGIIVARTDICA